jgi:twitching motility protein PilI
MANIATPFQWLQDLERRARQRARGLPRQERIQHFWSGIAFRVGSAQLLTPLNEIREVLPCPTLLAKVPGAKFWVRGLANIRGTLLPVIDLHACLAGKSTPIENRSRMIVISQAGINSGLLVDEVLGIKHFPEQSRDTETPCKEAWLAPFTTGSFNSPEEGTWTVFDMRMLAESELFLKAAL